MPEPIVLNTEEVVKTPYKHDKFKGDAIDWTMEKFRGEDLRSIIWEKEDEEGYNYFRVVYVKKVK
jgi:hypothetical protein